jgi:all-trans-retinol 13,14-reductase
MQSKYDIVIIGSGLGGLTAGYILSKNGYKVAIFEQGAQLGGCLQTFKRRGVKFETGVHYVGSLNEGQALDFFFRYLSLFPDIAISPLDPLGFDVVSFKGEKYKFAVGYENFVETLAEKFPAERENLKRYAAAIKKVADSSPFHSIGGLAENANPTASGGLASQMDSSYVTTCVNDFIRSFTSNETLQNVLVGMIPLYNGEKDKTPLYVHAFINDSNIQGAYRIAGGSNRIADSLVRSIRSFGGEVFASSKVSKIICDNSKATGVELENGTRIASDYIISNTHPEITVNMIDAPLIRPMYRNRICRMEQSVANFTVYLKFKKDTVPYMNCNYYHYNGDEVWNGEKYTGENWPRGYLYMHLCPFPPSRYAEAGEILTIMRWDEVARWADTTVERRGDEYRELKRRKAETVLAQLERDFPGILANVEAYYTSSPLTYRDYTGTVKGSMYGVLRDINAPRIIHRTKIPNLFLTGQNINAHGIMGVIIGAAITCSELLGRDFIFKQIPQANLYMERKILRSIS